MELSSDAGVSRLICGDRVVCAAAAILAIEESTDG